MTKRILAILLMLIFPLISQGGLIDDLNRQIQEQEAKRLELEKQAKEYQRVIDQKQGEIKSLNNQIAIYNARIGKLEVEIEITEEDISQTKLEITQLTYDLETTSDKIEEQKENLIKILQTIAEYDEVSQVEMLLQNDDFSDFFNQLASLENLQKGVQDKVEKLKSLKEIINQDKQTKEEKKQRLEELKTQLDEQKDSLAGQKTSKEALAKYTKGEESKYQKMLASIEAQKKTLLGDINTLRQLKAAELARLRDAQEKPAGPYSASNSWYYRQDDPAWAGQTIGLTGSAMANYGCAISSVAMVLTYHGESVTPGYLAKQPIFYYDLIIWPKNWGSVQMVFSTYRAAVDWSRIDRELGAGYPVIVRIQADGRNGGHYVVIHHKTPDGRYVVHDPLFGPNIYLESSRAFISTLYNTTTSINQMIVYH